MPAGGRRTPLAAILRGRDGILVGTQRAGELSERRLSPGRESRFGEIARGIAAHFRQVWGTGGIFSPGEPLAPPDPGRTRTWDFPVGWNSLYTPRAHESIGFAELRGLADSHDITRLVIETRKDQIEQLSWSIRSRDANDPKADAPKRIDRVTAFWRRPDGEQPFGSWLREALEDLLVIDAPAFEVRRNRGGEVIGLDVVDGATIKVLIDETGRRPLPPAPAYEQVIHGRPWRLLTSDELLYAPRNRRPSKAYGTSPVEQIVMTVNIALRRQVMQLQHFTDGNVPVGLVNAPDNWTVEQIGQFQEWFNAKLAGNTAERMKLIWGPAGAKYQSFKEAPFKDDFDEWLARIVCFAFSVSPNAFTRYVQRTTADTLQEAALKEGLEPLKKWVKHLADGVIQKRMGHPDLEFAWDEEEALDPQSQSVILDRYVRAGLYSLNEARAEIGFDPVEGGEEPHVYLYAGPVPVSEIRKRLSEDSNQKEGHELTASPPPQF
ncbi:MAG TPA: phage portal protein [Stellaceae bacterium]|nr:phage portal protein [Stellaceae bacterium]